jgi:hypothetical protein
MEPGNKNYCSGNESICFGSRVQLCVDNLVGHRALIIIPSGWMMKIAKRYMAKPSLGVESCGTSSVCSWELMDPTQQGFQLVSAVQ